MKSFYINRLLVFLFTLNMACGEKQEKPHQDDKLSPSVYRAINNGITADVKLIKADTGSRIIEVELYGVVTADDREVETVSTRVAGRIEQLNARYQYQVVKAGQKLLELYSPELSAAQRDYLFVAASGNAELIERSLQRLRLMGMADHDIQRLKRTQRIQEPVPLYSRMNGYVADSITISNGTYISSGDALFRIVPANRFALEFKIPAGVSVKTNDVINFSTGDVEANHRTEKIALLERQYRQGETFMTAKIYITSQHMKGGELITGSVTKTLSGYWLPAAAVWQEGSKAIVYRKLNDVFRPEKVEVKTTVNGQVLISTDIGRWHVAENASYFAENESFINAE